MAKKKKTKKKALIDYQTRRSIHIRLVKSTHGGFKAELARRDLSMQEVVNKLASLICEKDQYMMEILDTIEMEKREKAIKKVLASDAKSMYEIIEADNPFDNKE